jgi:Tol biopolymer transport system component
MAGVMLGLLLMMTVAPGWMQADTPLPPPEHDWLATGSIDGDIYIFDADTGDRYNISNHPANDYSPRWSPDGRYGVCKLASGVSRHISMSNYSGRGSAERESGLN